MAETLGQAYIEIIPTTKGIGSALEKELGGAGASAGMSFGNGFANVGTEILKTATHAVASGLKEAVDAGKDFDVAMSQVAATKGYKMDELADSTSEIAKEYEALRATALEYGSTTQFTATQAAEALNYMALAGWDAETAMAQLPNVLNLAAAGTLDLADASDMVTDISSAMNLSIEETEALIDQMAVTASKTNTDVAQLGRGMLKIGATAANMKGGTQELATALGMLANNGIKGAEGGTHLRNMLLSLENPGDKAATALERVGLSEKFAYDEMGNLRGMDEIFTDLSRAMTGMSQSGVDKTLAAVFNKTDLSSARSMLAAMNVEFDDLNGHLQELNVDWSHFFDSAHMQAMVDAETLLPNQVDIQHTMEEIGSVLALSLSQGMSDADISSLLMENFSMTMEEANAVVSAGRDSVVAYKGAWDDTYEAMNNCKDAASEMRNVQEDNLAGDIHSWESALEGVYITINDQLNPIMREFVKLGAEGLTSLKEGFETGGLDGMMASLGTTLSALGSKILEQLPTMMNAAAELLLALGQGFMDNLPMLLNTAIQIVADLANKIAENAPTMIPAAVEMILGLIEGLLDNADLLINAAVALIEGLTEGLINALPILLEKAPVIIEKLIEAIVDCLPQIIELAGQLIMALIEGIMENMPLVVDAGMKIIDALIDGTLSMIPAVIAGLMQIAAEFDNWKNDIIKNSFTWGADMLKNFIDGILSMAKSLEDNLMHMGQKIKDYIGFSEPKLGPLSNFHTYAPDMMELFAQGIKDNTDVITDQVAKSFDFGNTIQKDIADSEMQTAPAYTAQPADLVESDNSGLYEIMAKYLPLIAEGGNTTVSLEGDAVGLFNLVRRQNGVFTRANGRSAFA